MPIVELFATWSSVCHNMINLGLETLVLFFLRSAVLGQGGCFSLIPFIYERSLSAMKKGFGFYLTIAAIVLALAAGIYFQAVNGTFGLDNTHNGNTYHPAIVALLIGGAVLAAVLIAVKRFGLASAVTAAAPGAAICLFIYKCYWYITDVFVGIDEKHGFDPKFIVFIGLTVLAFLVGEIAVYTRKTREA